MAKRVNPSIHVIAADEHVGCQMGLMHPEGARLDENNVTLPNEFQVKLWSHWDHGWNHWLPEIVEDNPWDFINLGDAVDGVHHGAVSQWTHNVESQATHAIKILEPCIERCQASGGRYYHFRGTEAHGGQSGQAEERIADSLGAFPDAQNHKARWEMYKWIGPNKSHLVHYTHHISSAGVSAYITTASTRELVESLVHAARWGERAPDALVRAHAHRHIVVPLSGVQDGRRVRRLVVVVPGWQGKTPFIYRTSARQAMPEFGLVALILTPEGELYTRDYTYTLEREEPE